MLKINVIKGKTCIFIAYFFRRKSFACLCFFGFASFLRKVGKRQKRLYNRSRSDVGSFTMISRITFVIGSLDGPPRLKDFSPNLQYHLKLQIQDASLPCLAQR